MADADFWKGLAKEFRAIDPHGFLRADWHCSIEVGHQGPPPPTSWRLPGGKLTRSIQVEFEALARRAGPKVHPYVDSLNGWLEALKESGFNAEPQPGFGVESNEQGIVVAHAYFGTISGVCLASADLCKHYESVALEQERMADVHRESQAMSKGNQPAQNEVEETHPESTAIRLSREERLQTFVSENHTSVAAVGRAAGVFKTNMYQWRKDQMGDESVMAVRIENVLSGKTPLDARGKKKG